jgi:poly(hydroxyalkanoate) depolymerase family esterase
MNPFYPPFTGRDMFWSMLSNTPFWFATDRSNAQRSDVDRTTKDDLPLQFRDSSGTELLPDGDIIATDKSDVQKHGAVLPKTPNRVGPQWLNESFRHEETTHRFKICIPGTYGDDPLPLVVMLHGAHQDPDDFAAGTEMNAAAEAQGFIVLYPEQSEIANSLKCWNWFRPGDQQRESGETAMIAAMIRTVKQMYNIDAARVYVAGMSAGGAMAINLAVRHPELFAAAATHSGLAFGVADDALSAMCAMRDGKGKVRLPKTATEAGRFRAVPLIVFHGSADDIVHPLNGDQIVAMNQRSLADHGTSHLHSSTLEESAENGHSYTRRLFLDAEGVPTGEHWLVHGLGHAWSGGSAAGSHTDARGPRATKEILCFFRQFALAIELSGDDCSPRDRSRKDVCLSPAFASPDTKRCDV